jgi:hypothetical protein
MRLVHHQRSSHQVVVVLAMAAGGSALSCGAARAAPQEWSASQALDQEWSRGVGALAKCTEQLSPGVFGDADVTFRFPRRGPAQADVRFTRGLDTAVKACIARHVRQLTSRLAYHFVDAPAARRSLAVGSRGRLTPPIRQLLPAWRRALAAGPRITKTTAAPLREQLPRMVELDADGCLVTDETPSVEPARDEWLREVGGEVAPMWVEPLANRLAPAVGSGAVDAVLAVDDEWLLLSGRRGPAGREVRTLCLSKRRKTFWSELQSVADRTGSCWVGDAKQILMRPAIRFPRDRKYRHIATSAATACGLSDDERITCCGRRNGEPPAGTFSQLIVEDDCSCARTADGKTICWREGPLGPWTPPGTSFVSLSSGPRHVCGLTASGAAVCWGPSPPQLPASLPPVRALDAASDAGAAIHTSGELSIWDGTTRTVEKTPVTEVRVGANRVWARGSSGSLLLWWKRRGAAPEVLRRGVASFDASAGATCVIADRGGIRAAVECWGTEGWEPLPGPGGAFSSVAVASTAPVACGVAAGGAAACWGAVFPATNLARGRYGGGTQWQ